MKGTWSFRSLLHQRHKATPGAITRQEMPLGLLVEAIQPVRKPGWMPPAQVMFEMEQQDHASDELQGSACHRHERAGATTTFDLTVSMRDTGQDLAGRVEYNTDLFEAATVTRLAEHFVRLLEGCVADPDQCIADLPLLGSAEREQLLVQWNTTAVPLPQAVCVHQLFEAQVARTPDAVAVEFAEAQSPTPPSTGGPTSWRMPCGGWGSGRRCG